MTRHSLLWLIIIIAIFIFSPLAITSAGYKKCIDQEYRTIQLWYGDEEKENIVKGTESIYNLVMVDTKIDGMLRDHFTKPSIKNEEVAPGVKLPKSMAAYSQNVDQYWQGLLDNVYLFCLRMAQAKLWMFYMFPFLVASLFDGFMRRKAKIASFKYTSPTLYNASWHIIIFVIAGTLVAFSVTVALPTLAYPCVILTICLMFRMLISNIQHSA